MEQTHKPWSSILTKRQRSALFSPLGEAKPMGFVTLRGKTNFFLSQEEALDSESFEKDPSKKVKRDSNIPPDQYLSEKRILDSPSTRIDENSPEMIAFLSPQISFNEVCLGSPVSLDLESNKELDCGEDILNNDETDAMKNVYEINQEIQEILAKKHGKLLAEKEIYHKDYYFLAQCSFGHIWETSLSNLGNGKWCFKCSEKLSKCREFAKKRNWTLITPIFLPDLTFQCPLGHSIQATSKKFSFKSLSELVDNISYEHKTVCQSCRKHLRQEHLEHLREEEERVFNERLRTQEKLFEESRRKASEESSVNSDFQSVQDAYKQITAEIDPLALRYSQDFIQKKGLLEHNTGKYLQVYKILLIPDDILKLYLKSLSFEALKKEYRQIAKSVHPDKNDHPKAAIAFQKLNKLYEEALKSFSQ